jgi:cobalt/nickel transport system permease protein
MALIHAAIGLGEALITGVVVRFVLLTRPDLIYQESQEGHETEAAGQLRSGRWASTALAGLCVALAVAVFLSPLASEFPDGLEFVGQRIGFLRDLPPASPLPVPMPDYQLPVPGIQHVKIATAAAGGVGTLVVFAMGWWLARAFAGTQTLPEPRDGERVAADAA